MTYTLGQAAKATGKSKPTISRAIKKGTISAVKDRMGQYSIDPAELHAVYPPLPSASNDTGTVRQYETANNDKMLHREIELLREMLEKAEQATVKAEERETKWRQQAERITALIEDKQKKARYLGAYYGRLKTKTTATRRCGRLLRSRTIVPTVPHEYFATIGTTRATTLF